MYEAGQNGPPSELGDLLRRLEAALVQHERDLSEAYSLQDGPAIELLHSGVRLLADEIDRVRLLLP
jgi:hypothetical protein